MRAIRSKNKTTEQGCSEDEAGQTLVEYALILSFVAMALIGSLIFLEQGLNLKYDDIIATVNALT